MCYVLDPSAALQWVLPEKDSAKAIRLRDDYHKGVHELLAPDIFPAEMLNALTKAALPISAHSFRGRRSPLSESTIAGERRACCVG